MLDGGTEPTLPPPTTANRSNRSDDFSTLFNRTGQGDSFSPSSPEGVDKVEDGVVIDDTTFLTRRLPKGGHNGTIIIINFVVYVVFVAAVRVSFAGVGCCWVFSRCAVISSLDDEEDGLVVGRLPEE